MHETPNFSRLQVEAAGANLEKPGTARTVCDEGESATPRIGIKGLQRLRREFQLFRHAREIEQGRGLHLAQLPPPSIVA
jgi:hypothetical protein